MTLENYSNWESTRPSKATPAPVRVIRLVDDSVTQFSGTHRARHLFNTEIARGLAGDGVAVEEVALPRTAPGLRELRLAKTVAALRDHADVLLVGQGLGIRLAALRSIGLPMPHVAMISYDPIPSYRSRPRLIVDDVRLRLALYRHLDAIVLVSKAQADDFARICPNGPNTIAIPMAIDHTTFFRKRSPRGSYLFMVDGALRDYQTLSDSLTSLPNPTRLIVAHISPLSAVATANLDRLRHGHVDVTVVDRASGEQLRQLYEDCIGVIVPLLPSRQPAGLTALLEAMAMECAVIVTQSPWLDEYVSAGSDTLVVPERDPLELGRSVSKLMAEPDTRRQLAANAGMRAKQLTFGRSLTVLREAMRALAYSKLEACQDGVS